MFIRPDSALAVVARLFRTLIENSYTILIDFPFWHCYDYPSVGSTPNFGLLNRNDEQSD